MSALAKFDKPAEVNDSDLVMGGSIKTLLPAYSSLPEEFQRERSPYCRVVDDWFFSGLKDGVLVPKDGVDKTAALRHAKAVLRSWEPKHEHKTAGVAYLLSRWFDIAEVSK